jgi:fructosamine-3-kinase
MAAPAPADLGAAIGTLLDDRVLALDPVHGGDVARSFRVELERRGTVFAKTNPTAPPEAFTAEAAGLRWLAEPAALPVAEVLAVTDGRPEAGEPNLLVLAWIDEGPPVPSTEAALGRSLAALHRAGASCFGREDRRRTGSRGLPNEPCATWADFYATQRLLPLARLARDEAALPGSTIDALEAVAGHLEEVGGPPEPPARLHGDLWAGNRLVDAGGRSWLIDPAVHGGHREFDLAMMRLFGGFGDACFAAYQEVHPLADGWPERVALHQLAPLVVHAIKFGGGYVRAATEAIAGYG